MAIVNVEEKQYLDMVKRIIDVGYKEDSRNGSTRCLYGEKMEFSLEGGVLPLLTSKKVAWRTCLRELLWFISGSTSNDDLKKKNVKIWDGNSTREFLDSRNLHNLEEGDLGPVYGHQWRHFNAPYVDHKTDYTNEGVDQLDKVIYQLKHDRQSRRIILCAWNPAQLDEMALPPCHAFVQFHVVENSKLICCLYQRSGDVGLGVPFNIASYSFLTHLLAHHTGLIAHKLIHFIGNAHIYETHVSALLKQLSNPMYEFPVLNICLKREKIDDYVEEDFNVIEYNSANVVKMEMVA
tara:strand:+ start:479 stop:1357 length:879 start_codon:yes stop_codon:yes gene_type:complete